LTSVPLDPSFGKVRSFEGNALEEIYVEASIYIGLIVVVSFYVTKRKAKELTVSEPRSEAHPGRFAIPPSTETCDLAPLRVGWCLPAEAPPLL
jgi:hypothetical protein